MAQETREQLRLIDGLHTQRAARDARGLFFIEGVRNLLGVLDAGWRVETLLFSDRLLTSGIARSKVRQLRRGGVRTLKLSPEQFRSLSRTQRASGVAAVVRYRVDRLLSLAPGSGTCWLVLENIRSPGNLGTLVRTSLGAGGGGIIALGTGLDLFSPDLVRASMGALFHQRLVRGSVDEFKRWVERHALQVVGATPESPQDYFDFPFRAPAVIVLGDERKGLSSGLRSACNALVRIPMVPGLDSLNVSVAGEVEKWVASLTCAGGSCRRRASEGDVARRDGQPERR